MVHPFWNTIWLLLNTIIPITIPTVISEQDSRLMLYCFYYHSQTHRWHSLTLNCVCYRLHIFFLFGSQHTNKCNGKPLPYISSWMSASVITIALLQIHSMINIYSWYTQLRYHHDWRIIDDNCYKPSIIDCSVCTVDWSMQHTKYDWFLCIAFIRSLFTVLTCCCCCWQWRQYVVFVTFPAALSIIIITRRFTATNA
jgi:hypothetical protein